MVQPLQSWTFLVQVFWILLGDPQYAFVPAGSVDEIEISLVPRDRWPVINEEGTKPVPLGFYVRSDRTKSRITLEELVA